MIIVDASVALAWCLADEKDEIAERVLDRVVAEGAAAPAHWPLEVANGLLTAERRGRLEAEDAARAAQLLAGLGIEVVSVELATAAWSIRDVARELGLTVYDAAYLDLARFRGLPLATLDDDMIAAAGRARVDLAA